MESQAIKPVRPETAKSDPKGWAIAGFIASILSLGAWLIPIVGAPLAGAGLYLSIMEKDSSLRKLAITGIVLACIGLSLSVGYGVWYLVLHAGEIMQEFFQGLQTGGY